MGELKPVVQIMTELGDLSRDLDVLVRAAERAIARRDVDSLCEVAEEMLQGHVAWAEKYRALLVAHVGRSTRTAPVSASEAVAVPLGWGRPDPL